MGNENKNKVSRRDVLKLGLATGAVAAAGSVLAPRKARAAGEWSTVMPVSPLILDPFTEPVPLPKATRPTPVAWDPNSHDSVGTGPHTILPSDLGLPDPITYEIPLQVGAHEFTSSRVQTQVDYVDAAGNFVPAGTIVAKLPPSTIYGFNGAFPGARINAEYGQPVLIRFVNQLDQNPLNMDRQDFGSPEWRFLTHLHNGHTAPESDGNPHYLEHGYDPGQFSDNLYLNYPPENDDREKQSFLWFHDHQHSHTGANVYKGMVGLFPIYDPKMDSGDERAPGYGLPGIRTNNPDGTFDVDYDIPLALYDVAFEDGVVPHEDWHNGATGSHPEWWGKHFFQHIPDKGFMGDVFTVNCKAYPVLNVERRKYRFRFLGASISRCYRISFMSSAQGPVTAVSLGYNPESPECQGQYRLTDGQICMNMVQIAVEGGLIPVPLNRTECEIWPAKRREFIMDFTQYIDGTPTTPGDVIYMCNTMPQFDGLKPDPDKRDYVVPMMKIVVGDLPAMPDMSIIPASLRALKPMPLGQWRKELFNNRRVIELGRGSDSVFNDPENIWLIRVGKYTNGSKKMGPWLPFDAHRSDFTVQRGAYEVWEVANGGGGWTHPMHIHQDEHQVVQRNGVNRNNYVLTDARHMDDAGKEDVVALDPGESVLICKEFRTTWGKYVAHCHQLAHEDHAMMFSWTINP